MRSKLLSILFVFSVMAFVGCDDDNCIFDPVPATPQGVFSVTGDGEVYLYWNGPYEADIVEFIIWRSNDSLVNYTEIGRRPAESNPELHLWVYEYIDRSVVNSVKYFYAVSAVDLRGQVSELSAEVVFDTPRPEDMVALYDAAVRPNQSGFHFGSLSRVDTLLADVYVDRSDGIFFLNTANLSTNLQDMGHTDSLDEIGWAPQEGWSALGRAEIVEGHMYVIRTGWPDDTHFAKMRVEATNEGFVTFSWASQRVKDNPELVPGPDGFEKPVHGAGYLRRDNKSNSLK